jgi:hypothetical protein
MLQKFLLFSLHQLSIIKEAWGYAKRNKKREEIKRTSVHKRASLIKKREKKRKIAHVFSFQVQLREILFLKRSKSRIRLATKYFHLISHTCTS